MIIDSYNKSLISKKIIHYQNIRYCATEPWWQIIIFWYFSFRREKEKFRNNINRIEKTFDMQHDHIFVELDLSIHFFFTFFYSHRLLFVYSLYRKIIAKDMFELCHIKENWYLFIKYITRDELEWIINIFINSLIWLNIFVSLQIMIWSISTYL